MKLETFRAIVLRGFAVVVVVAVAGQAQDAKTPYPSMAPLDQYLMARDAEIALARSAAPDSISKDAEILVLGQRLAGVAARYRERFGVDVSRLDGAGAGGGLAGGLAAIGGTVVPGFDVVADVVGLDRRLAGAAVVVTGEGRLDRSSLDGKVTGAVVDRVAGRAPVLVVVGEADRAVMAGLPRTVDVVDLTAVAGRHRARRDVTALVEAAVGEYLRDRPAT